MSQQFTANPNGDYSVQWGVYPAGSHYAAIDEGVTSPDTSNYISTRYDAKADEFNMQDAPADTGTVAVIQLRLHLKVSDILYKARIKVELVVDGQVVGTLYYQPFQEYNVWTTIVHSWSGLSLTKEQYDGHHIRVVSDQNGGLYTWFWVATMDEIVSYEPIVEFQVVSFESGITANATLQSDAAPTSISFDSTISTGAEFESKIKLDATFESPINEEATAE